MQVELSDAAAVRLDVLLAACGGCGVNEIIGAILDDAGPDGLLAALPDRRKKAPKRTIIRIAPWLLEQYKERKRLRDKQRGWR